MSKISKRRSTGAKGVKPQPSEDIYRELGRLAEATENSKHEREAMRQAVEKLSDVVQELRAEFRGLNQTMQSTATTIATLTADRCGQRLDVIETKNKHYDRVLGNATTFMWKVVGTILTSALTGAGAIKLIEHI